MDQKKYSNILKRSAKSILEKTSKSYLPSRHQVEMYQPKSPKTVFNHLEQLCKTTIASKFKRPLLPKIEKENRSIKRTLKDQQNFQNIFVKPRENLLSMIKPLNNELMFIDTHSISKSEMTEYVNKAISFQSVSSKQPRSIYEQQIKVEPPTLPNSSIASPLTPGNGYSPSIPPVQLIKQSRTYLKDLLLRCQTGSNVQDAEKQSHLSFFLGLAYQKSDQYDLAIKFFQRFMKYARLMDDRIGLALGTNRIGCNEYYLGNYQRSILFHQENIRLSDSDNVFSGMYNLGIINRKIQKEDQAIQLFQSALAWAQERNIVEQVCLIYGQLGTTYLQMGQKQQAYKNFQKGLEFSKIANKRLYLDSLLMILNLSINEGIECKQDHEQILQKSLKIAEELNLFDIVELCLCNIGILRSQKESDEQEYREADQIQLIE